MFSNVIYQHYHMSLFSIQIQIFSSLGLIRANIFRRYLVSKIREDFEYFLIHFLIVTLREVYLDIPRAPGHFKARAPAELCILPVHPASVSACASHSQALCVLAPMIALPW